MSAKDREVAESVFDKNKRREAEINSALHQEHARHEAAMKNMQRLRSLRLDRDAEQTRARQQEGPRHFDKNDEISRSTVFAVRCWPRPLIRPYPRRELCPSSDLQNGVADTHYR